MPPPPTFDVQLVAARALAPEVRELVFARVDGAPVAFEAGQWVTLVLPGGPGGPEVTGGTGELRRSYSIASHADGSARFDLAVTRVRTGHGSHYLHELAVGAKLTAIGPQGFFTRARGAAPSLYVATGTGVTPFRSMLRAAEAQGDATPTWLLFGARHEADVLYREELESLAARAPHVRVCFTLSRGHEAWAGRRGYVQLHVRELLAELAALPESAASPPHVWVCGLEKMVGAVRELVRGELGLPRQRVHSERYD